MSLHDDPSDRARLKLRKELEELSWAIDAGQRCSDFDIAGSHSLICDKQASASSALKEYEDFNPEEWHDDEIRSIRRLLDELALLGLAHGSMTHRSPSESVHGISNELKASIRSKTEQYRKQEEDERQREYDQEQVRTAIKHHLLLEWVRRNPDRGYSRKYPPFQIDTTYDRIEGGELSWTSCVVWVFNYDHWIIGKTFDHREAPVTPDTEFEHISPAAAAHLLLASDAPLTVSDLIELRRIAQTAPPQNGREAPIVWNRDLGELTVDGTVARKVKASASRVVKILNAFQEDGWPRRIDSPFPSDESNKERLRDAVRMLNKGLVGIRFESDGEGMGVRYYLNPPGTTTASAADNTDDPF